MILGLVVAAAWADPGIRIDSSFAFQSNPAKEYSLYIPSSYVETTPNRLLVALHPWSALGADGWCDHLMNFAELNNLILACPQGESDAYGGEDLYLGAITEPMDTAFTNALIDTVMRHYNIDPDRIYLGGFSWGGLRTYHYGLANTDRFAGYLPIGAYIQPGFRRFIDILTVNAQDKPFYMVHGSADYLQTCVYEMVDQLTSEGATVAYSILEGASHQQTITHPEFVTALTTAISWLDSMVTQTPTSRFGEPFPETARQIHLFENFPNPFNPSTTVRFALDEVRHTDLSIFNLQGQHVRTLTHAYLERGEYSVVWDGRNESGQDVNAGLYICRLSTSSGSQSLKMLLLE